MSPFGYTIERNQEKDNLIYFYRQDSGKKIATIDEEKETRKGKGLLTYYNSAGGKVFSIDISLFVRKKKEGIQIPEEDKPYLTDQLITIFAGDEDGRQEIQVDGIEILAVIFEYEDCC